MNPCWRNSALDKGFKIYYLIQEELRCYFSPQPSESIYMLVLLIQPNRQEIEIRYEGGITFVIKYVHLDRENTPSFFCLSDPSESRSDVYTLASQFSNTRLSGIEEISGTEMVKEHSGIWIAYITVATEFCCKVIHLIKIKSGCLL